MTLSCPPAPPMHLNGAEEMGPPTRTRAELLLKDLPLAAQRTGLTDPRLIGGIADLTAMRDPRVENVDINGCDQDLA
jgi:hypothetical protein